MKNLSVFYEWIAKFYDLLDVFYFCNESTSPRKALEELVPEGEMHIADICIGTAVNSIRIAKKHPAAHIVGVDRSKEMLRMARKKLNKEGISNIKLYYGSADNIKIEENVFDIAVLSLVLHECTEVQARNILKEAYRILKADGKLLIMEWEEPRKLFRRVMFGIIRRMEPKEFENFLKMDMKEYMRKNGFEIIKMKHCDYSRVLECRKVG